MLPEIEAMALQYKTCEADHNALNIRLEDFRANFTDTVTRMFAFVGVPDSMMGSCARTPCTAPP